MKIAVIGNNFYAPDVVLEWHEQGAHVEWFWNEDQNAIMEEQLALYPDACISDGGARLTTYWQEHLLPANEKALRLGLVKQHKVLSVHKSFLNQNEIPKNSNRLADTFRVVYEVVVAQAPDVLDGHGHRLAVEIKEQLSRPYERYTDVDLVIDCRWHNKTPLPLGASRSRAIGESILRPDIFYGYPTEKSLAQVRKQEGNILLVGSGAAAASWLCTLGLENSSRQVELVTTELSPFLKLKNEEGASPLRKRLDQVFLTLQAERRKNFLFYLGYNVSGLDRLQDQDGVFITIEAPVFRQNQLTEVERLKTLRATQVICATGFLPDLALYSGLALQWNEQTETGPLCKEPGLYFLWQTGHALEHDFIATGPLKREKIREDVLRYFSKK